MSQKVAKHVLEKQREAIASLSIGEFITSKEAAEILKVSKQAFSKNSKIKRGFIYSVKIGNRNLYHSRSVSLFGERGDGRFPLLTSVEAGTAVDYRTPTGMTAGMDYGPNQPEMPKGAWLFQGSTDEKWPTLRVVEKLAQTERTE